MQHAHGLGCSCLRLQDVHEVFDLHHAVWLRLVRLSFVDHLLKLGTGHIFTKLIGDALQVLERDVILLLREQDEGLL